MCWLHGAVGCSGPLHPLSHLSCNCDDDAADPLSFQWSLSRQQIAIDFVPNASRGSICYRGCSLRLICQEGHIRPATAEDQTPVTLLTSRLGVACSASCLPMRSSYHFPAANLCLPLYPLCVPSLLPNVDRRWPPNEAANGHVNTMEHSPLVPLIRNSGLQRFVFASPECKPLPTAIPYILLPRAVIIFAKH